MADELYLNLMYPGFDEAAMAPRLLSLIKNFPFSATRQGVGYVSVLPISWNEPTIFERSFQEPAEPQVAIALLEEFAHDDYAMEVEAAWDLWVPKQEGSLDPSWTLQPQTVRFIAHGLDFDEACYKEDGHIQINFGLDTYFLYEEADYTPQVAARVKSNIQKLVGYTQAIEMNCGITGRVLWSESEENLAQKLIAKLQKVQ